MSVEVLSWQGQEAFAFGNTPEMAERLGALVVEGVKTATCWAASQGCPTEIGKRMVVLDGQGRGWAVVETVELTLRPFGEVDATFAHDEGEGDRSLADWRCGHERYFRAEGTWSPDMLVWCERFKVVEVLEREAPTP